jgi:hypothetical protein
MGERKARRKRVWVLYTVTVQRMYSDCMNINLRLSGVAEKAVDDMIKYGYATSKTEAIRLAILDYKHHHIIEPVQMTEADLADLEQARKELREGKTSRLEEI